MAIISRQNLNQKKSAGKFSLVCPVDHNYFFDNEKGSAKVTVDLTTTCSFLMHCTHMNVTPLPIVTFFMEIYVPVPREKLRPGENSPFPLPFR